MRASLRVVLPRQLLVHMGRTHTSRDTSRVEDELAQLREQEGTLMDTKIHECHPHAPQEQSIDEDPIHPEW